MKNEMIGILILFTIYTSVVVVVSSQPSVLRLTAIPYPHLAFYLNGNYSIFHPPRFIYHNSMAEYIYICVRLGFWVLGMGNTTHQKIHPEKYVE